MFQLVKLSRMEQRMPVYFHSNMKVGRSMIVCWSKIKHRLGVQLTIRLPMEYKIGDTVTITAHKSKSVGNWDNLQLEYFLCR